MTNQDKYIHGMDWANANVTLSNLKNYRKFQYHLIKKYIGKNILEVGSGDRGFTKLLVDNVEEFDRIHSIEPSRTFFERFIGVYKFPKKVSFECIDLFDLQPNKYGNFDTAILIHVLEHIEDDFGALQKLNEMLESNGRVLIEVPALPKLYSVHDEILGHYRRYSKSIMMSAVDQNKFFVEKMFYSDLIGVLGSYYFFKIKKTKLNSSKGKDLVTSQGNIYDNFIIPVENFIEKIIHPPIGLSLTCILRKK